MGDIEKAWMYLRKSKYNDIMDSEELREVLCLCGKDVTEKQSKIIMKNEGGIVSYDRLVDLKGEVKSVSEEDIMRAFKTFDKNGDKFISLSELKIILQKLGEKMSSKEVDKLFETLDVDKDGNLDYSEFTGLYTSTNKQLDHLLSLKVPDTNPEKAGKVASGIAPVKSVSPVKSSKSETDEDDSSDDDDDVVVIPSKKSTRKPVAEKPASKIAPAKKADDKISTKSKAADKKEEEKSSRKSKPDKKPSSSVTEKVSDSLAKEKSGKEKAPVKSKAVDISAKVQKDTRASTGQYHRNVRGCTYAGERGNWTAHQYLLTVKEKTKLAFLISPLAQSSDDKLLPDLTLYLVKKEDSSVVYMSKELSENGRVTLAVTVEEGEYVVQTHTTSCNFVNESTLPVTPVPVKTDGNLSSTARKVLENVFHCLDLDGDRLLSRSEFELFHATSSGEPLDDAMWRVIKDNFDLEDDCVTLEGFTKLHEMALEDEEGGEEEIRETLTSMGYNEALLLVKAVPWHLDVYADTEIELSVQGLVALTSNQTLERSVVRCLEEEGNVAQVIEEKCKLFSQILPWKSTSAIQNMTDKPLRIEVNTVGSANCLENPPYRKHILTVAANKTMICHHFSPEFRSKPFKPTIKIRTVAPAKPK